LAMVVQAFQTPFNIYLLACLETETVLADNCDVLMVRYSN